jgi:hypothetical protein
MMYAAYRWSRSPRPRRIRDIARHLMDGSTVFPLALLSVSVLSRRVVEALLSSSRVTLSIAGAFALLAVLGDEAQDDPRPAPRPVPRLTKHRAGKTKPPPPLQSRD